MAKHNRREFLRGAGGALLVLPFSLPSGIPSASPLQRFLHRREPPTWNLAPRPDLRQIRKKSEASWSTLHVFQKPWTTTTG
jgi:hypothetical protein